jgi:hypothetical protein
MIDPASVIAATLFHLVLRSTICLLIWIDLMSALQQGVFQAGWPSRSMSEGRR